MSNAKRFGFGLCAAILAAWPVAAQDFEQLDGATIYDYDPATSIGDDVFGTVVCDFENDAPGRNSHGGPVCMEYANGDIVAFHTNASGHNLDGWSEFAVSEDGGETWSMYNKFPYSYEAYLDEPTEPAWVEEGLVTENGTVVLFVTQFAANGARSGSGVMRSTDHGETWSDYEPIDGSFVGYPAAVAVDGSTSYVLYDNGMQNGPHVLYSSTDNGETWSRVSTLPLQDWKWYGALCVMKDGALLAGAYDSNDETDFFYCISDDGGQTWTEQQSTPVDKKIRDPELGYLRGRYYLHGRSGHYGAGSHRFVLYQSEDGENWGSGVIISGQEEGPDGYSHNCIINKYNDEVPNELMVEYSIQYDASNTNEYVFFIRPDVKQGDVNEDGDVDALDIQRVINTLLGLEPCALCDVNNDGSQNALDLQTTINIALGVPS